MKQSARITELDGLRGLAILLVIMFHYYAARPDLLPFGSSFENVSVFKYGFLGVELFFMISGYVIFMSIDASTGLSDFARKRWLRLFPAMVVATIGIMLTAPFLTERPLGLPRLADVIPGLTFIEADWYRGILGVDVKDLEGAFWSLYVEVRFYIIVSVLYFSIGRRKTVFALGAIVISSNVLKLLVFRSVISSPLGGKMIFILSEILLERHLAWFLIGIATYLSVRKELGRWEYAIVLSTVGLTLSHMRTDHLEIAAALTLTIIFLAVMWHRKLLAAFRWRPFVFLGAISYPLYLFHENSGIALIIKLGKLNLLPSFLLPVLVLAIMLVIAYIIAIFLEPTLRGILRKMITANRLRSSASSYLR